MKYSEIDHSTELQKIQNRVWEAVLLADRSNKKIKSQQSANPNLVAILKRAQTDAWTPIVVWLLFLFVIVFLLTEQFQSDVLLEPIHIIAGIATSSLIGCHVACKLMGKEVLSWCNSYQNATDRASALANILDSICTELDMEIDEVIDKYHWDADDDVQHPYLK